MVSVSLFLSKFSAMKIETWKCYVDGLTKSCHGTILGKHTIEGGARTYKRVYIIYWEEYYQFRFFVLKVIQLSQSIPLLLLWNTKNHYHFMKYHIKWMGGHPQFCGAVHHCTEAITYKIKSRLRNGMFSAQHLSIGGYLNKLYILVGI